MIILFIYKEDFEDQSFDNFVSDAGEKFNNIIFQCGKRYLVFNNKVVLDE